MVDKLTVLIVFMVAVFAVSAVLLIMGTVPKIFETSNQVNQTNVLLEQRIALTEQQKHEDEARAKQTQHEDEAREIQNEKDNMARDKQRYQIVSEINSTVYNQGQELKEFIKESENRSAIGNAQRLGIMHNISLVLENLNNKTTDHNLMTKNMNTLQIKLDNVTGKIFDIVNKFGPANNQLAGKNQILLQNLTNTVQELKKLILDMKY